MHSLPRHRTAVGREQEDFRASASGRADHSLADSETHLARGEVRHHDDQTSDELLWRVRALDAGEDVATQVASEAQRQLHQFVGPLDVRRRDNARDTEIDLREVVDRTEINNERFFFKSLRAVGRLRAQGGDFRCLDNCGSDIGGFALFDHGLHLFEFNSFEHVLEIRDGRASQRRLCILPTGDG